MWTSARWSSATALVQMRLYGMSPSVAGMLWSAGDARSSTMRALMCVTHGQISGGRKTAGGGACIAGGGA